MSFRGVTLTRAILNAALAAPDSPAALLLASMLRCTHGPHHSADNPCGFHFRRSWGVSGSRYREELNFLKALDLDGMLEAILFALFVAFDAAAGSGRARPATRQHALIGGSMRRRLRDPKHACPYGTVVSPGPCVLERTRRKRPQMYRP